MPFSQELVNELNILVRFSLTSIQEGIKVHHDAEPSVITATQSLYDKGLLTLPDGGYLTDLGLEAAELADKLLSILTTPISVTNV